MITVKGSDIATITTGLHSLLLSSDRKFTYEEAQILIMAEELLSTMYYHSQKLIEKDVAK